MTIKIFEGHRLFRGLGQDFLQQLEEISVQESRGKGEMIVNDGDPADNFYILEEGRICIRSERNRANLSFLHTPGDFFGWSCLLDRQAFCASAESVVPSKIIRIEKKKLDALLKKDSLNGLTFIKNFADIIGGRFLETKSAADWFPSVET